MLTRESGTSFSDARLTSVEFVDVFILYNMFNGSKKNAFHLIGKPPHRKLVFRFARECKFPSERRAEVFLKKGS